LNSLGIAAVKAAGFVARRISFWNEAGPAMHQAVALLVMAPYAVVYQCEVKGYQDTLYAHSEKQFYRECHIYGTVDFIFGSAMAVFQNCTLWARRPTDGQKNVITAQKRDPKMTFNTGFSFQGCHIQPAADLQPVKSRYPTYLGRPWSIYSRVSFIDCYIGDHVDPRGWLAWNEVSPTDKLYYGEYNVFGPGADTTQRVKWLGVHANMTREEAEKFTLNSFISGQDWIPATGVPYQGGL